MTLDPTIGPEVGTLTIADLYRDGSIGHVPNYALYAIRESRPGLIWICAFGPMPTHTECIALDFQVGYPKPAQVWRATNLRPSKDEVPALVPFQRKARRRLSLHFTTQGEIEIAMAMYTRIADILVFTRTVCPAFVKSPAFQVGRCATTLSTKC